VINFFANASFKNPQPFNIDADSFFDSGTSRPLGHDIHGERSQSVIMNHTWLSNAPSIQQAFTIKQRRAITQVSPVSL